MVLVSLIVLGFHMFVLLLLAYQIGDRHHRLCLIGTLKATGCSVRIAARAIVSR